MYPKVGNVSLPLFDKCISGYWQLLYGKEKDVCGLLLYPIQYCLIGNAMFRKLQVEENHYANDDC